MHHFHSYTLQKTPLKLVNWFQRYEEFFKDAKNPGGVNRFELDRGVPLVPQNPYPSLRVILAEKGTHF